MIPPADLVPRLLALSRELAPEMERIRRAVHAHPELGFEEERTAGLVAGVLERAGWDVRTGVARTGVVARLGGSPSSPAAALRADMDALPIAEETGLPFASDVPGVMHACGHDGNVAAVAGAALLLSRVGEVSHPAVCLFQPSEETFPGGAIEMIDAGVIEDENVGCIYAVHAEPSLPVGSFGVADGVVTAAADSFELDVVGAGAHGAQPHKGRDAVTVASEIVLALQTIVSRRCDPMSPAVLSVGTIEGGRSFNVVADRVRMSGTVRALTEDVRAFIQREMEQLAVGIAEAHGLSAELRYQVGNPPLLNDRRLCAQVRGLAELVAGSPDRVAARGPEMVGEDFAYFGRRVPVLMAHYGVGPAPPLHSSRFVLNDAAVPPVAALLAAAVLTAEPGLGAG